MNFKPFNQPGPQLGNQYDADRVLRTYLRRVLPSDILAEAEPPLREMGELAGGELYQLQLDDRLNMPMLTQWSPWGERIDHIEVTAVWKRAERLAAEFGVVATAYDRSLGRYARPLQFAMAYLFHPSTDVYTCPLAMTDGAARTLLLSGNQELIQRAVPHLTSRDPATFWTSGQWMTESTGGSDVGTSETMACRDSTDIWQLFGRKWFTSAATSQIALTLARPGGGNPGGRGLALFYLELRDENGRLNNIEVNRLKDKLGTRKLPTAELMLKGTPAIPVMELANGVRNIVPMLHLTRTWNSVMATATMRRGVALARDYAQRRQAFGALLADQPLHIDTLARLQAETEAAFLLSFFLVELIGRDEAGDASTEEVELLRLLTSIAKLTTGRQAVDIASEVLEAYGGAGYIEDTGLPLLLRDSQVMPIWEGTTNVLSLDVLRAVAHDPSGLVAFNRKISQIVARVQDPALVELGRMAIEIVHLAIHWLQEVKGDRPATEAGARRFAQTLGRALSLALMVEQAQWSLDNEHDGRARAAARRFARGPINLLAETNLEEDRALANDESLMLA